MGVPWTRLVLMLALTRFGEDGLEGQLAQFGYLALSWALSEAVTPLARRLVLNAQARDGQITHETARKVRVRCRVPHCCPLTSTHTPAHKRTRTHQTGAIQPVWLCIHVTVGAVCFGGLAWVGHTQMPLFLLCTTAVLPLFQAACFPAAWPSVPLLVAALGAIWLWEGVRPLFLGLALFQLLPVLTDLALRSAAVGAVTPDGATVTVVPSSTGTTRALWWLALLALAPLTALAGVVLYAPDLYTAFLTAPLARMERAAQAAAAAAISGGDAAWAAPEPTATPLAERLWALLLMCLGVGRGADDPWRVLKLARGSSSREIKKRMRELSLAYHPDKVGNNPVAHARFLAIQAAADKLTGRRGGTNALSEAVRLAAEQAKEAAQRSVECVGVVGMWIATSVVGAVTNALHTAAARRGARRQAAAMLGNHGPMDVASLRVRGARPLPRMQPLGDDGGVAPQVGGEVAGGGHAGSVPGAVASPEAVPTAQPVQAAPPARLVQWALNGGKEAAPKVKGLTGAERRAQRRAAGAKSD